MRKKAALWALCAAVALAGPAAARTTFISIGTGGTGGVYYPYGGGLAEIWSKYVPGVKAVAEVTGASVENVKLAHKGETVIGEVMGDVAYQAYRGIGKFQGKPQKILAMACMYPNVLQIVTLKGSGIQNVTDFKGKRVSIGAPGSGTAFMAELVLKTLGVPLDSFNVFRLSFNETANALRDGTIDAGFWVVAPGTSSIMDLATTHDIEIVGFTPEQQKKVEQAYDYYSAWTLEGGVYRGVDQPVPTLSVWNVIICQRDLPEDLVYQLTKTLFEHTDYLEQIHPFAKYTTPENAVGKSPIPFHPGAIRAIEEKGIKVPAKLRP
ncbi:TAXI family TRAP transporter solute-binding subunit [Deferrisoma camini]|uniref:TAXI family TRAP transporter solute-binding subunit n=1 Tax=Deferrisoma camini TaxID=1035120 RepID=UPI00046D8B82|nr:TAXI family TRAP transporter solute-binding subunit [Deferrisoma camini]